MPLPAGYTLDETPKPPDGYKLDTPDQGTPNPADTAQTWADKAGLREKHPVMSGALDLLEGAASGAASTVFQGGDMIRRATGMERVIDRPEVKHAMEAPRTTMGTIGKAGEQVAEFAIPGTGLAKATKGAGLLTKAATQGVLGGGVAALQTGGDPTATTASAALGAAGPAIGAGASRLMQKITGKGALKLYQGALRPTWTMMKDDGGGMIKFGLENEIPVSSKGLEQTSAKIADIGKAIDDGIVKHAAGGRTIDTKAVLAATDELEKQIKTTATPQRALDELAKVRSEFESFHGQKIPIDVAQKIKVNTYRELRTAYGEMKAAKVESLKQVTRGVREQIEKVFPEVAELNEQQMHALNLEGALERAVWQMDNQQIMSMGKEAAAIAGGALGNQKGAISALWSKIVLDDPRVKSKLAVALYRAGNKNPIGTMTKRMATIKGELQAAASGSRDDKE